MNAITNTAFAYRTWSDAERVACEHFHVSSFRPGQRELIEAVLRGRDAVGILPTGGGKSLCFQLPALFMPKAVVVVSPLLALIGDQNAKLARLAIPTARIDSTLRAAEGRRMLANVAGGTMDLVYLTPEALRRTAVRRALAAHGVSLFVIDEAHCISQWGHDFRPAYLALADAFEEIAEESKQERPPILALTATASTRVASEIPEALKLEDPIVVRTSCERPNLRLEVVRTPSEERKEGVLRDVLAKERGAGIIYTTTVKTCEAVWSRLVSGQIEGGVGRYHGELSSSVREATQKAFMDGRYRVMVATKAFGMGIDKSNVRFVVHYEVPDSMESYLQEVGRAGRDGAPSRAVLLYRIEDRRVHDFFMAKKYASDAELERLLEALAKKDPIAVFAASRIADEARISARKVEVVLHMLRERGVVSGLDGELVVAEQSANLAEESKWLRDIFATLRADGRARAEEMRHYCEAVACRWAQVQRSFGDEPIAGCGRCDVCSDS